MAQLQLKKIDKVYDNKVQAVFDFSLDIEDKEFIVFVGPSGCGKSTTLRMIAGLEDITGGELYIDGKYMNHVEPKDREIAMVFQSYALYPHMTVYENMAFGLKIKKIAKDEIDRRVKDAARVLEIEEYLDRKPKALSGGQRQRVALGRAIVRNAKVFLMDEPLSNLDAKLRVQMRSEIIKLHERIGSTTIYVTHDQTEAMTMATRIVVMKAGYIQQIGTPKEIYNNPSNMFVASFVGAPATNFMVTKIIGDHLELERKKYRIPDKFQKSLKPYDGKNVVIGIRPENLSLETDDSNSDTNIPLDFYVEVSELLGHESILHGLHGTQPLVAKIQEADIVKNHQNVTLHLDLRKSFFFDEETQKRIYSV
ncbi:ABC transporter ATP-binding protein [Proteiniclasticum sp. C24MP]|uniref:ABC transporter ATP-binding protein n=1 Tax=Proteiniclasticum sp. C24MP TaxID=3374101 RepID=UPI003754AFD9